MSKIWILGLQIEMSSEVWLNIRNQRPKNALFWNFIWYIWKANIVERYSFLFEGEKNIYSKKN